MMSKSEKKHRRQMAYQSRAKSARLFGKLLIPAVLIVFSTALWSDPVLGPQLAVGLEEIQPTLATLAIDTPLEDVFGPPPEVAADPEAQELTEEAALQLPSNMPNSVIPVNRP